MQNLENLGIKELTNLELKETGGGWIFTALIALAIAIIADSFIKDGNDDTRVFVDGKRVGN